MLDVTVTGTQLERMLQRGKALAADVRQRYEASGQDEPAAAQPLKKRKKVCIFSGHTAHNCIPCSVIGCRCRALLAPSSAHAQCVIAPRRCLPQYLGCEKIRCALCP